MWQNVKLDKNTLDTESIASEQLLALKYQNIIKIESENNNPVFNQVFKTWFYKF